MTNELIIGLENYPNLDAMYESDPEGLGQALKSLLKLADEAKKAGYFEQARQHFQMDLPALMKELVDGMFDYKGILKFHYSPHEAEAMSVLEMENHPLASTAYYTTDGKSLSRAEFFGAEDLSVKEWFQSLLYFGKFMSHVDIARYMLLPDYHLVEHMQNEHIERLIRVQPALQYQKAHDIRLGLFLPGTGFFDIGKHENLGDTCPACAHPKLFAEPIHEIRYCLNCLAGVRF